MNIATKNPTLSAAALNSSLLGKTRAPTLWGIRALGRLVMQAANYMGNCRAAWASAGALRYSSAADAQTR